MRVKCANCGMIWEYKGWLGDCYAYPRDYRFVISCPHCGSNAFDVIEESNSKEETREEGVA